MVQWKSRQRNTSRDLFLRLCICCLWVYRCDVRYCCETFLCQRWNFRKKKGAKQSLSPLLSFCMCFSYFILFLCLSYCAHTFLFLPFFIFIFYLYLRWLMCNSFYSVVVVVVNIFPFVCFVCFLLLLFNWVREKVYNCPFPRYPTLERS